VRVGEHGWGDDSPGSREAEGEGGEGFYVAQSSRSPDLLVIWGEEDCQGIKACWLCQLAESIYHSLDRGRSVIKCSANLQFIRFVESRYSCEHRNCCNIRTIIATPLYAAGFREATMLEICDVGFRRTFLVIDSAGSSLCTYVH
jgi:hypothetical protein